RAARAAARRRHAGLVSADQKTPRLQDRTGRGDAPPGRHLLAHAEETAAVPAVCGNEKTAAASRRGSVRPRRSAVSWGLCPQTPAIFIALAPKFEMSEEKPRPRNK